MVDQEAELKFQFCAVTRQRSFTNRRLIMRQKRTLKKRLFPPHDHFVWIFLAVPVSPHCFGAGLQGCVRCRCLQGVWQVVCAACKPPDVSETSHWRRRRQAGCNSRRSGLITTGAWMPSGALGTDSRSGTHLDSETVPWKK